MNGCDAWTKVFSWTGQTPDELAHAVQAEGLVALVASHSLQGNATQVDIRAKSIEFMNNATQVDSWAKSIETDDKRNFEGR